MHLVPAIAKFMRRHPNVRIDLDLSQKFADLVAGGADVVIRQAEEPRLQAMVARKLAPLRWVLCASPSYLSRCPVPPSPTDLARHECLTYPSNARGEWTFSEQGGAPVVARVSGSYRASNADGALKAALAGLGVAALPTFAAAAHLHLGALVRLLPHWRLPERVLYAVWLPGPNLPQRVQALVRFLGERLGAMPARDRDLPGSPA